MIVHGGFSQNSRYKDEHTIITKPIKVMVVDNNKRFLYVVAKVLNYFGFEVTAVDHGGTALAILSKRLENFDLVLIDSNLSDVDAHTFLRITKHIDIQSILMSKEDDDQTLLKAFKDGALLVIKRPLTGDRLRLLRQHAIRKRIQNLSNYNLPNNFSCVAYLGNLKPTNSLSLVPNIGNPNFASAYPWIMKKEPMIYDGEETTCESISSERKMKIRMVWTPELHAKFMDAIGHLGEGRCVPKLIHELMGIPGITRAQVSSHLQANQTLLVERWHRTQLLKVKISSLIIALEINLDVNHPQEP